MFVACLWVWVLVGLLQVGWIDWGLLSGFCLVGGMMGWVSFWICALFVCLVWLLIRLAGLSGFVIWGDGMLLFSFSSSCFCYCYYFGFVTVCGFWVGGLDVGSWLI